MYRGRWTERRQWCGCHGMHVYVVHGHAVHKQVNKLMNNYINWPENKAIVQHISKRVCACTYMYIHLCAYVHAHVHVCAHIHRYIHMHIYIYTHVCMQVHMHASIMYPCTHDSASPVLPRVGFGRAPGSCARGRSQLCRPVLRTQGRHVSPGQTSLEGD